MISDLQPVSTWEKIKLEWDSSTKGLSYCDFDFGEAPKFIRLDLSELKPILTNSESIDNVWNGITSDKIIQAYNTWERGVALSPPSLIFLENGKISVVDGWHRLKVANALKEQMVDFVIRKDQYLMFRKQFKKVEVVIDDNENKYGKYYLYGRYENLEGLINNSIGIRFTDIISYAGLENEAIRDNESIKELVYDSTAIKSLTIEKIKIEGNQFVNVTVGIPSRRCHCLCLSRCRASEKLYEKFKADVCLEIYVDFLVMILEDSVGLMGAEIIAKPVEYVDVNPMEISPNPTDIVFVKNRKKYGDEEEFRIAIFYPYDEKTEIKSGVKVFGGHEYIQIHAEQVAEKHPYITEIIRKGS